MFNCSYSLSSYLTKIQSISITKTLFGLSTHLTENSLSQLLGPIINTCKSNCCPTLTIQTPKSTIWANCPASNVKASVRVVTTLLYKVKATNRYQQF